MFQVTICKHGTKNISNMYNHPIWMIYNAGSYLPSIKYKTMLFLVFFYKFSDTHKENHFD